MFRFRQWIGTHENGEDARGMVFEKLHTEDTARMDCRIDCPVGRIINIIRLKII